MAKIVDLHETEPDLAALAAAIARGEESEIVIADQGRPLARLVPIAVEGFDEERERALDLLTGA